MVNKIVASYIFIACIFAISLYLGGVRAPIHLTTYFQSFVVQTNSELAQYRVAIPDIPLIPVDEIIPEYTGNEVLIITAFINFAKGFFEFINFLVRVINILSTFINVIIQVIEFAFIFLKNIIVMRDNVIGAHAIV